MKVQGSQINFVKIEQVTGKKQVYQGNSYFQGSQDWEMKADLDRQLQIPVEIAVTNQRPDLILYSHRAKKIGVIELTIPSEERVGVSNEIKKLRYAELVEECNRKGYAARIWAVEVGSRGFPAASANIMFKDIGLSGRQRKAAMKKLADTTIECSQILWWRSNTAEWGTQTA